MDPIRNALHNHRNKYSLHSHPVFENICNATELVHVFTCFASFNGSISWTLKVTTTIFAIIIFELYSNHFGNLHVFLLSSQYIPFSRMLRNVCSSEAHFSIQYSRSSALSYAISSCRIHSEKFFMFLLILSVLPHSLMVLFPMNLSTRTYIYELFVARPITYG